MNQELKSINSIKKEEESKKDYLLKELFEVGKKLKDNKKFLEKTDITHISKTQQQYKPKEKKENVTIEQLQQHYNTLNSYLEKIIQKKEIEEIFETYPEYMNILKIYLYKKNQKKINIINEELKHKKKSINDTEKQKYKDKLKIILSQAFDEIKNKFDDLNYQLKITEFITPCENTFLNGVEYNITRIPSHTHILKNINDICDTVEKIPKNLIPENVQGLLYTAKKNEPLASTLLNYLTNVADTTNNEINTVQNITTDNTLTLKQLNSLLTINKKCTQYEKIPVCLYFVKDMQREYLSKKEKNQAEKLHDSFYEINKNFTALNKKLNSNLFHYIFKDNKRIKFTEKKLNECLNKLEQILKLNGEQSLKDVFITRCIPVIQFLMSVNAENNNLTSLQTNKDNIHIYADHIKKINNLIPQILKTSWLENSEENKEKRYILFALTDLEPKIKQSTDEIGKIKNTKN